METNNNQVNIVGTVSEHCVLSHEMYGEKFYELKLEVPRLSESNDILPVTVSERLVDVNGLVPGTLVNVEGQFRSYNNHKTGDSKLKLTIFARDVQVIEENDGKNPNSVFLNGYICKKPIYRTTPLGREICDIIVAVNRPYRKSDYVPVITWGRNARFSENLNVGDNIKIWGRVQSRQYDKKVDDENIIKKTAYEVSVSKIEIPQDTTNSEPETTESEA